MYHRRLTLLRPVIVIRHSTAIVPYGEVIIGRQCPQKHRLSKPAVIRTQEVLGKPTHNRTSAGPEKVARN